MLNNVSILITGATGSFGRCFIREVLKKYNPSRLVIFSRDEMKQWELKRELGPDSRLRFFLGDVRDKDRLLRAFEGIDYVVHAAAMKIVDAAEYDPFECIKTNVIGAMNVIDAALATGVKKLVALSTDKASAPINLYGASKLASDKLFIASNKSYSGGKNTKMAVVRYGNVIGSRGSVIPFFYKMKEQQSFIPITDERMTRFMISLPEAVDLVLFAFEDMVGGETYVPKIPSITICDLAEAIAPELERKVIGVRPGEKLHEQMIGVDESGQTFEYDTYFKILPTLHGWSGDPARIKNGTKVADDFRYSSEINTQWMTAECLRARLESNFTTLDNND